MSISTKRIRAVLAIPVQGAFFYEDLAALRANPTPVSSRYLTGGLTPGYEYVRQPARAVSIGLALDNGQVVWGDCVGTTYGAIAGRAALLQTQSAIDTVHKVVAPLVEGQPLDSYRRLAAAVGELVETVEEAVPPPEKPQPGDAPPPMSRRAFLTAPLQALRDASTSAKAGPDKILVKRPLHPALRYGLSQALLAAVARANGQTITQQIVSEYGLSLPARPVPIHAQAGQDWYAGADKMIARRVASLPAPVIDDVATQLGQDGQELVAYVRWLKGRIQQVAMSADYQPTIHLDFHGALGALYGNDLGKILGLFARLAEVLPPYYMRVESPILEESRAKQIAALAKLHEYVSWRKLPIGLVADEWANDLEDVRAFLDARAVDMIHVKMPDMGSIDDSIQAVLACRQAGVGALLGGSSAETHLSATISCQVALATQPDLMLAKPGMGIDEAVTLAQNEMTRVLAQMAAETS